MWQKNTYMRALFAMLIVALFALPLTLQLVSKPQTTISSADETEGTTLVFDPAASEDDPVEIKAGEDLPLVLRVQPGADSRITFVKYVIEYDPDIFEATSDDFIATDSFPELLEAPNDEEGKISASLSVGSNPENAVSEPTDVGEVLFRTKDVTKATKTSIVISEESEALSIGERDSPTANVLVGSDEVFINVVPDTEEAANPTTTPDGDEEEEEDIEGTNVNFSALLHGIGSSGDSANPQSSSLSNKSPKNTTRPVIVAILDENGEDITRNEGEITFDKATGKFAGSAIMDSYVSDGTYTILIMTDRYLPFEKEITIDEDSDEVSAGEISLIAGDIVPDGALDILDYNTLTDCGYGIGAPLPMNDSKSAFKSDACQKNKNAANADLDDNGIINSQDFNLFLRELSSQSKK